MVVIRQRLSRRHVQNRLVHHKFHTVVNPEAVEKVALAGDYVEYGRDGVVVQALGEVRLHVAGPVQAAELDLFFVRVQNSRPGHGEGPIDDSHDTRKGEKSEHS